MNFKRYRDWLIVVLALAVPFWFLRASMKDSRQAAGPDRILIQISAPIQQAAATLARGLSDLWGDYVYLVEVKQDNTNLSSQNARLKERVSELESEEAENHRLRQMLGLKKEMGEDVVTAQVIGKNTNEYFRVLRITLDRPSPSIAAIVASMPSPLPPYSGGMGRPGRPNRAQRIHPSRQNSCS